MVSDSDKKRNREVSGQKIVFQIVGILILIIFIVLVIADFKIYQEKRELNLEFASYQKKIDDIKKSNQALNDEISNSDNPEYLEKIAYEQGMTKNGEKEFIFISPKSKPISSETQENFWNTWFGWIGQSWMWIKSKF